VGFTPREGSIPSSGIPHHHQLHAKRVRPAAAIVRFRLNRRDAFTVETLRVFQSAVDPDQRYSGLTSDVAAGLSVHNAGQSPHTSKHRPWILLAAVEFIEEARAVAFERYLKSGSGRAFARRHFG
jgi:putative endonuclease